jgi:hypothetical protein
MSAPGSFGGGGSRDFFYFDTCQLMPHNLTHKKASLLAAKQPHPVNLNIWIEDFFCPSQGKIIWRRISKNPDQSLVATEAGEADWKRTTNL